jgi:hypothetical protein
VIPHLITSESIKKLFTKNDSF